MKKAMVVLLGSLLASELFPQTLLRNPAKPLNAGPGRVLRLEPVFEIRDDAGPFFFKHAARFDIDSRGCLFVLDTDQLLKFSTEGRFLGNFFRKGQGPGEIATRLSMVSFVIDGEDVYIYDGIAKIVHFDASGRLVGEVRQNAGRFFELFGLSARGFLMRGQSDAPWGGGEGFKEIETSVNLVSMDGSSGEKIAGFPSRVYEGNRFGMDWDNYLQAYDRKSGSLYVSSTCEYRVLRADLAKPGLASAFTREYPRVPFVVSEEEKDFYARTNPPRKEFANDVVALCACGDGVWVETSTRTKGKGALYDVFDADGRFLDSFYLREGAELRLVEGPFVFMMEKDRDETIIIRKCRVRNGPKL